jgi:hypothetical protein
VNESQLSEFHANDVSFPIKLFVEVSNTFEIRVLAEGSGHLNKAPEKVTKNEFSE